MTPTGSFHFFNTRVAVLLSLVVFSAVSAGEPTATRPADADAETDALIRRLRGSDPVGGDIEQRITRLMDTSHERLGEELDTGPLTREVQTKIIEELNAAIEIARRNQSRSKRSAAPRPQQGETRQSGRKQEKKQESSKAQEQSGESSDQPPEGGGVSGTQDTTEDEFAEFRRGWGHLPDRDREEVIQGFREDSLRKYAELIEDYYRALAEETNR